MTLLHAKGGQRKLKNRIGTQRNSSVVYALALVAVFQTCKKIGKSYFRWWLEMLLLLLLLLSWAEFFDQYPLGIGILYQIVRKFSRHSVISSTVLKHCQQNVAGWYWERYKMLFYWAYIVAPNNFMFLIYGEMMGNCFKQHRFESSGHTDFESYTILRYGIANEAQYAYKRFRLQIFRASCMKVLGVSSEYLPCKHNPTTLLTCDFVTITGILRCKPKVLQVDTECRFIILARWYKVDQTRKQIPPRDMNSNGYHRKTVTRKKLTSPNLTGLSRSCFMSEVISDKLQSAQELTIVLG